MFRLFRFLPTRWWSPWAWKKWANYIHWRLETYGVYYPDNRFSRKAFIQLLRQTPSYSRWLADFDQLHEKQKCQAPFKRKAPGTFETTINS